MENQDIATLLSRVSIIEAQRIAKKAAVELGLSWTPNLAKLVVCIKRHPEMIAGKFAGVDLRSSLMAWLKKYQNGLRGRFATKIGKPPGVKPDPAIRRLLRASNPGLSPKQNDDILDHHILGMAVENSIGNLLEDYIASKLEPKGWIAAWGSTLKATDFYKPVGEKFLQVKNRSNSENSSSKAIRTGTDIKEWHRIDARTGDTFWKDLEELTGVHGFSEEGFFTFIDAAIAKNPKLLYRAGTGSN